MTKWMVSGYSESLIVYFIIFISSCSYFKLSIFSYQISGKTNKQTADLYENRMWGSVRGEMGRMERRKRKGGGSPHSFIWCQALLKSLFLRMSCDIWAMVTTQEKLGIPVCCSGWTMTFSVAPGISTITSAVTDLFTRIKLQHNATRDPKYRKNTNFLSTTPHKYKSYNIVFSGNPIRTNG